MAAQEQLVSPVQRLPGRHAHAAIFDYSDMSAESETEAAESERGC